MHERLSTRRAGNDGVNRVMNQKETTSHAKFEEALGNLYNLEEEIEEDPTPFTTHVRLKEALGNLPDLEREEEIHEAEEKPLIGVFKELELVATDTKGKIHKIGAMDKGVLHAEKLKRKERNPDLIHLCSIGNSKVYYNIPKDQYWIEVYQPTWINNKRMMKKVGSIKLEPHDFETMKMLGILYDRDFNNPLPQTIYVKKKDRKKAKQIMRKFKP